MLFFLSQNQQKETMNSLVSADYGSSSDSNNSDDENSMQMTNFQSNNNVKNFLRSASDDDSNDDVDDDDDDNDSNSSTERSKSKYVHDNKPNCTELSFNGLFFFCFCSVSLIAAT